MEMEGKAYNNREPQTEIMLFLRTIVLQIELMRTFDLT
jgi:hypothetical protein